MADNSFSLFFSAFPNNFGFAVFGLFLALWLVFIIVDEWL
jgi:hypothetical protein